MVFEYSVFWWSPKTLSNNIAFLLFIEQVIAGLDRAAATMKKGEQAILKINPEYGFGSIEVKRDLASVPPCSILVYEVEMLDFVKVETLVCMRYSFIVLICLHNVW